MKPEDDRFRIDRLVTAAAAGFNLLVFLSICFYFGPRIDGLAARNKEILDLNYEQSLRNNASLQKQGHTLERLSKLLDMIDAKMEENKRKQEAKP